MHSVSSGKLKLGQFYSKYFKNFWIHSRYICTNWNAFFVLNSNIGMDFFFVLSTLFITHEWHVETWLLKFFLKLASNLRVYLIFLCVQNLLVFFLLISIVNVDLLLLLKLTWFTKLSECVSKMPYFFKQQSINQLSNKVEERLL